jgi:cytochrome c-type biogenesis protein CcmH
MCKSLLYYCQALCFFSLLASPVCFAATEIYPFTSLVEKQRFHHIIQELRCLVCQNQNLADSNALLAKDLRQLIYTKIKQGESESAIKNYLVSRYGEFILFKPVFSPLTYLLWLGPFILFAFILIKATYTCLGGC